MYCKDTLLFCNYQIIHEENNIKTHNSRLCLHPYHIPKGLHTALLPSAALTYVTEVSQVCPTRPERAETLSPRANGLKQHALKGQKLLAQGIALGMMAISNAPCKGKSFKIHLIKMENPLRYVKLLPLQGVLLAAQNKPRAMPWARSFCPFRACCLYGFLGLQGVLLI